MINYSSARPQMPAAAAPARLLEGGLELLHDVARLASRRLLARPACSSREPAADLATPPDCPGIYTDAAGPTHGRALA